MPRDTKTIRISFIKYEYHDIDELHEFQGELKELYEKDAEKLWKQIQDNGFADPFIVWESKGKLWILSGHQRKRVLKAKRDAGWEIPKLPCAYMECESEYQAKKMVLSFVSQYGKIADEGLYQFVVDNDITEQVLRENYKIPEINMDWFIKGYLNPEEPGANKEPKDGNGGKSQETITCPICGHMF